MKSVEADFATVLTYAEKKVDNRFALGIWHATTKYDNKNWKNQEAFHYFVSFERVK